MGIKRVNVFADTRWRAGLTKKKKQCIVLYLFVWISLESNFELMHFGFVLFHFDTNGFKSNDIYIYKQSLEKKIAIGHYFCIFFYGFMKYFLHLQNNVKSVVCSSHFLLIRLDERKISASK